MRKVLPLVLIILLAGTALALRRDAFWGTWKVVVTPDDEARSSGAREFKDTLTFKADQFASSALKAKGFESAQYTEDTRGGVAATFKSEIKNKKTQASATWSGTSTGAEMTGEMTWKTPEGTEQHYTFKGSRGS